MDLISTGKFEITCGIKITSMVLKLPCEFGIWSLNSKSSGRDLLGTCIPRFLDLMPLASNHVTPWNITVSDVLCEAIRLQETSATIKMGPSNTPMCP